MSRIYTIVCSCGCLIAPDEKNKGNGGLIPCFSDNCKSDEEYYNNLRKKLKHAFRGHFKQKSEEKL